MTFIEAIAKVEGFGASLHNIPTAFNNPGDICAGQFANANGAKPGAPDPRLMHGGPPSRYAVFPTAEQGWCALRVLLRTHYCGMTVEGAVSRYAPPSENDTPAYIAEVCKLTGMQPTDILTVENIG